MNGRYTQPHPVTKRLFQKAELKDSNLVISADLTTPRPSLPRPSSPVPTSSLGAYIGVFKTHIDLIADFPDKTVTGLQALAPKHHFLVFEERKLVGIGHRVQKQYHGGALRLWGRGAYMQRMRHGATGR